MAARGATAGMGVVNLTDLHRRLLRDALAIGTPYPLVITGGYAVQAYGLVGHLSRDLDVARENPTSIDEIVCTVSDGLAVRGWGTTAGSLCKAYE
ncbi:hypothetical protein GCM10010449_05650 [Streptomyces rectiviolaceus]|uniref:Nucleotidyl transferase AbiEii/AbiGii toxin family protein n=1 Tax=Streptomyces rectiviolaceus TaxID=332591 RepID=A0ABP6MAD2_9ACTN